MNALTEAQLAARKKAIDLLSEHFNHYVVIVETEIDDPNNPNDLSTFWCGAFQGHSASVGLLEKYKNQLLSPREDED